MRTHCACLTLVGPVALFSPAPALADLFVQPFMALNSGSASPDSTALGVSGGWMGRWFGGEGEVGWSRWGAVRPYAAPGVGVLRSHIEEEPAANVFPERFGGLDFWRIGGGVAFRW